MITHLERQILIQFYLKHIQGIYNFVCVSDLSSNNWALHPTVWNAIPTANTIKMLKIVSLSFLWKLKYFLASLWKCEYCILVDSMPTVQFQM